MQIGAANRSQARQLASAPPGPAARQPHPPLAAGGEPVAPAAPVPPALPAAPLPPDPGGGGTDPDSYAPMS
jgi:hypothetical protein